MDNIRTKALVIICFVSLLFLHESAPQVLFPDGSFTTQPSIATTGSNQFFFGSNGNNASTYIQTNVCFCVNTGRCYSASGGLPTDGSGLIDIRIVNSASGVTTGVVNQITTPVSSGITPIIQSQSFCQSNLDLCCPSTGYSCGIRYSPYSNAPQPTGSQAPFGSQPWTAVILTSSNLYVGVGVLIDHLHILTVAHKVNAFATNGIQLKIRLGEWDAFTTNEPIPYQEFTVARVFVHPQYSSSTLSNSIAIIRLNSNVPLGQVPTITTACLSGRSFIPRNSTLTQINRGSYLTNMRCWVAGWGASNFGSSSAQSIQTHVDVPIVDQNTCQSKLRTTKLGSGFVLDTSSFMCAGGEAGKDACTGDGGAPLVCPIAGRWYVVGLVAWGIGCGATDIPGVYMNVSNYINWIQSTTRS